MRLIGCLISAGRGCLRLEGAAAPQHVAPAGVGDGPRGGGGRGAGRRHRRHVPDRPDAERSVQPRYGPPPTRRARRRRGLPADARWPSRRRACAATSLPAAHQPPDAAAVQREPRDLHVRTHWHRQGDVADRPAQGRALVGRGVPQAAAAGGAQVPRLRHGPPHLHDLGRDQPTAALDQRSAQAAWCSPVPQRSADARCAPIDFYRSPQR